VTDRADVFEGVKESLVEVLLLKSPEAVKLESSLIGDLGADSLDILDLIFHLEERFSIKISKDEINYYQNLGIGEDQTHVEGVLTEKALARLREMMPEVDPARLVPGLKVAEVPRLISVQALVNLVCKKLDVGA
jgi:acyl carrier protein